MIGYATPLLPYQASPIVVAMGMGKVPAREGLKLCLLLARSALRCWCRWIICGSDCWGGSVNQPARWRADKTKGGLSRPFARLPVWQLIVDDRGTVQFVVAGGCDDLEGFGTGCVGFGRQFVFGLLRSDAPLTVTTPAFADRPVER